MDFACKICNKKYKSYQSLWNHNHKFHATTKNTLSTLGIHSDYIKPSKMSTSSIQLEYTKAKLDENDDIKNNICKFCNKELYNRQSRWRHELKCQIKNNQEDIKSELVEIKNEIKKLKNTKNGPTTNIKVHGNIIGTNTDTGPKQIIYKTGTENMNQISYNEVSTIFDNEISSVVKLIELVNFSENKPENHSFCSTALESPYLSFYNTDTNTVNKERKRYFFEDVICKSIQNHEILYSKFKNKFDSIKRKQIEENILNLKKIKANSFCSKIIGEMIRNLNLLSYNKRDLVQDTWSGKKYDRDSDEEFMAMLLNDPKTQAIIEANKNKSDNSDSEEERVILPLKFDKKNIIV